MDWSGEAIPPFASHGFVAVVIANFANEVTLAHEIAHVLINTRENGGHVNDHKNLMYVSPSGTSQHLTSAQIEAIRRSEYVTLSP